MEVSLPSRMNCIVATAIDEGNVVAVVWYEWCVGTCMQLVQHLIMHIYVPLSLTSSRYCQKCQRFSTNSLYSRNGNRL